MLIIFFTAAFVIALTTPGEDPYDLLIKNGRVLDGTGNSWYYSNIAIKDGRIAWMGKSEDVEAVEVIDASGQYVSPGFIDVHSHASSGLAKESLSHAQPLLAQGITTVLINPDGGGSVDMAGQQERIMEHGVGVNVAQFIPHGSLRREVMGMVDRAPTDEELEEMKQLVEKGMQEGAFGLSSGLFYTPGAYAETGEVIELAKVVGRYNGVYSSHIRDESDYNVGLIYSVEEVISVAREANIPGIVTHIKALGTGVWGYSAPVVHRIEKARNEGVEVFADQYPYPASKTSLTAVLIPAWAREGGRSEMLNRLEDREILARIKQEMVANMERRGGPDRIQIADFTPNTSYEGKMLSAIAETLDMDPIDAALELIKQRNPGVVSFNMHEDDVAHFMKKSWTMTGSDGGLVEMGKGVPHPRNYGSFPRKIAKYVQEDGVVDLPHAIRSMTSLSASVFGMQDRGLIRPGAIADLVIFNLENIKDNATYQDPHQLSEGMEYVLLQGKFAVKEGEFMPELHGEILRKQQF